MIIITIIIIIIIIIANFEQQNLYLNSYSYLPKKLFLFYLNENPLKRMNNTFLSCQKVFPFLKYFYFCPEFLVMLKNGLIRKLWLISKFSVPQTEQQIRRRHITQYLRKERQQRNEISSVSRI